MNANKNGKLIKPLFLDKTYTNLRYKQNIETHTRHCGFFYVYKKYQTQKNIIIYLFAVLTKSYYRPNVKQLPQMMKTITDNNLQKNDF